jgi:hypothetical protein
LPEVARCFSLRLSFPRGIRRLTRPVGPFRHCNQRTDPVRLALVPVK